MKILIHTCCGPCAITVIARLKEQGHDVSCFFYNPNIHPLVEYLRRREGAQQVAAQYSVPVIMGDSIPVPEQVWTMPEHSLLGWQEQPAAQRAEPKAAPLFASPLPEMPPAASITAWLRAVQGHEHDRCLLCWYIRLERTAAYAAAHGFDAFTTSLFYSRWQPQEQVKAMADAAAQCHGVTLVHQDFRLFWQEGVDTSKELGIYRQPYCGCIFSEYDRYARKFAQAARLGSHP